MNTDIAATRRLRKDAEHNRQRIVDAARDLFAIRGLEATHNEVARHAGVGVGTVYRRFPTRDSLYDALFEDLVDQISRLGKAALEHEDSWEGFVFFLEGMCRLTARDQGLRQAVFSRAHGGERLEAARRRVDPIAAAVLERVRSDGHVRADLHYTDMPIVTIMVGAADEFVGADRPELWRRYLTILLDGMRSQPTHAPLPQVPLTASELDEAMMNWKPPGR